VLLFLYVEETCKFFLRAGEPPIEINMPAKVESAAIFSACKRNPENLRRMVVPSIPRQVRIYICQNSKWTFAEYVIFHRALTELYLHRSAYAVIFPTFSLPTLMETTSSDGQDSNRHPRVESKIRSIQCHNRH
jgi:hypothetical protein